MTDVEELRQRVEEELDRLDQEVVDNSISEWRKRLTACVAAGGGHSFFFFGGYFEFSNLQGSVAT